METDYDYEVSLIVRCKMKVESCNETVILL